MNLKLVELTDVYAKEICDWKYDNEYSIYNYPNWDKASCDGWAITLEDKRKKEFFAVVDDSNNLCGHIRLQNKSEYVSLGLGLKPCLCGNGLGNILMKLSIKKSMELYSNKKITLEVRSFNERAIKCYKKAGFKVIEIYKKDTPIGYGEFIRI